MKTFKEARQTANLKNENFVWRHGNGKMYVVYHHHPFALLIKESKLKPFEQRYSEISIEEQDKQDTKWLISEALASSAPEQQPQPHQA